MTTWEGHFKDALLGLVKHYNTDGDEAVRVVGWEEDSYTYGYCETCRYPQVVVEITYETSDGTQLVHTYRGSFASLMRELEERA